MATFREHEGKTPGGGVRSRINFLDADGNPAEESQAVRAEIIEYDARGNQVGRTYGDLDREDYDNAGVP
jgi:hypothetical protein